MQRKLTVFFILFHALSLLVIGQSLKKQPFSWDNASVYFVIPDRFHNGNTANDKSYNRGNDGNGNAYAFDQVGGFYGGDIAGLNQKITEGYFDKLGINAIWITAPYEQIHGWVAGRNGSFRHYPYHGYYPLDWTEMDANMGTKADFKAFVDNAHEHGIRVIMDVVMNHTGYSTIQDMSEYNFGCLNDAWKGWRPSGGETWNDINKFADFSANCNNWSNWWSGDWVRAGLPSYPAPGNNDRTMSLAGLPDVRTESTTPVNLPPVLLTKWDATKEAMEISRLNAFFTRTGYPRTPRNYIVKWLTDWVREFGIDGFRVDTEKHVEGEAWKALKDQGIIALKEWKAANPNKKLDDLEFWMTAESFGACKNKSTYHINSGFNSVINFCFQNEAGKPADYEALFTSYAQTLNSDPEWNVLSYLSSHDTRLFDRNNLFSGATSLMLLPGAVQVFYGDETGRPFGPTAEDPDQGTRSYMNWTSINQELLSHWQKLGQFRRNHLAVGAGSHKKLNDSPYTFKREYKNDIVVITTGAQGATTIDVSSVFADGTMLRDFYTDATAKVLNGKVTFTANARGVILIERAGTSAKSPLVFIEPASGRYLEPTQVTITASGQQAIATIYYTTDGTTPTTKSSRYTGPFTVTANTVVKAIAVDKKNELSAIITREYAIGKIPGFTVHFKKPADWASTIKVYYWETDPADAIPPTSWPGVNMTLKNGWYEFAFDGVNSTNLIFTDGQGKQTGNLSRNKEGWFKDGVWHDSNPDAGVNTMPEIQLTPVGPFASATAFTATIITSDDSGLEPTIYYTTDGSTPNLSSSFEKGTISLLVSSSITLKFFARDNEGLSTPIQSHEYTVGAPTGFTVFFKKPADWASTISIYHWGAMPAGSLADSQWPGRLMTDEGDGWFSFTFEGITSTNLIFNDRSGEQTQDLNRNRNGWFVDEQWFDTDPRVATAGSTARFGGNVSSTVSLDQNYPNPVTNQTTTITFSLPTSTQVTLKVFNWSGTQIATLVDKTLESGKHTVHFNKSNLSSGVYMYQLTAGGQVITRRLVITK